VFRKPLKRPAGGVDKASEMGKPLDTGRADREKVVARRLAAGAFVGSEVRARPDADCLHVCPACASELVFPVRWAPAGRRSWRVDLRCPDCEWSGGGVYPQPVVDRFDEALDAGTDAMLNDLALLARANMETEAERFASALRGDHILPEDF
jgi:hypothetical protein